MKFTNIPIRKCIACQLKKDKSNFIMVVRSPKKEVSENFKLLDGTGKKEGRAAYICKKADCVKNTIRYRKLEKIFRKKMSEELYENLKKAELIYE